MQTTISKDQGMGPYCYVLQYRMPQSIELLSARVSQTVAEGESMFCVFTTWDDLEAHRSKLESNGISTQWDLAIDRMHRAGD